MRITSKGQVTIPLPFRERFGLHPGTEITFTAEHGQLFIRHQKHSGDDFDKWLAQATGSANTDQTTDEIMAETRGED